MLKRVSQQAGLRDANKSRTSSSHNATAGGVNSDAGEERKTGSKKKAEREEHKDVGKYLNYQRTLIFSTRGLVHRDRHFMTDLRDLLPHSRKENKFDTKDRLREVNEVAELKNCNNVIFFEARKHKDLYMYLARVPEGPTFKFLVQNVHTMSEIKLTGNCLKGSRPVLHFDTAFNSAPQYRLMKELLSQAFGSPKGHPKVKPFIDHIFGFYLIQGRVFFRNYQIVYDANNGTDKEGEAVLVEIGPRFVLTPIKVFGGSFGGPIIWENTEYTSPNLVRSLIKRSQGNTYLNTLEQKQRREEHLREHPIPRDELDGVFE